MSPAPGLLAAFAAHPAEDGEWTPLDLPGLIGWWDASSAGTITQSGGLVSAWADKSGNGYTLSEATNKPLTGSNTINSLNVLTFDESNDILQNTSFATISGQSATLYVVGQFTSDGGFDPLAGVRDAGANAILMLGTWSPNTGAVYQDFGTSFTGGTVSGNAPHQWTIKNGPSTASRIYLDGVSDGNNTGAAGSGARFAVLNDMKYAAEFIITNTPNADADREAAEAYLQAKWGTP